MQLLRPKPILPLCLALSPILLFAQLPEATGIAAGTGTIQGTAADAASHKPVGSAIVTAVRAGLPPFSQTVTAGPDGTFQFQGLAAGTYTLCAQALAAGYLNPCEFASVPVTISLAAGQKSATNVVGMVAGSVLHVRIQDPQQLVAVQMASQKTGGTQTPDINVGVWGHGNSGPRFFPARVTGTDSAGLDYQVTVPRDTLLALHVSSRHLQLAGATGSALAGNTSQVKFQHKTGDANPVSFAFAVTAVLP